MPLKALATCFLLLIIPFSPSAAGQDLAHQRTQYNEAVTALSKGDKPRFRALKRELRDYPLYPYLLYAEYRTYLERQESDTIARFLTRYQDTPLAGQLRKTWLDHLRKTDARDDFLNFYSEKHASIEHQCYRQQITYPGPNNEAIRAGIALWRAGESRPKACDPLFDRLIADGHISDEVAWQRYVAAILNHEYGLANYITRFFSSDRYQNLARRLLAVDREPITLNQYPLFDEHSSEILAVIARGLQHLARQNAEQALSLWNRYHQSHTFSPDAEKAIVTTLIRELFRQGRTLAADTLLENSLPNVDSSLVDWRLQQAIKAGLWQTVLTWADRLPPSMSDTSRWLYWRARALEMSGGDGAEVQRLLGKIAHERSFYGFLAAESLGQIPQMQHRPVDISSQRIDELASTPPFRRAEELLYHGDTTMARREWWHQLSGKDADQWIVAAKLAERWQWHHQAITSMIQAGYWDDIGVRFPLAYQAVFTRNARETAVPLHLLMALSRQESSFAPSIVSPAGARGLMQLMPATAAETAKREGIRYSSRRELFDPDVNVRLGSRYYRRMLERFDNNRILATAAYNAGPARVDSWLRQTAGTLPYDAWIEVIPFPETRNYVQNVLAFSMIYAHKLNLDVKILEAREKSRNL